MFESLFGTVVVPSMGLEEIGIFWSKTRGKNLGKTIQMGKIWEKKSKLLYRKSKEKFRNKSV